MSMYNAARRLYYDYLAGDGAQTDKVIQGGRLVFGPGFKLVDKIVDVAYSFYV